MNPKVDAFLAREAQWRPEFETLRAILLGTGLAEELKWGQPCYALEGKNVALLHGFKEYCAVLFHKGALLKDPKGLLIQQTENVQSARQLRFKSLAEVKKRAKTIEAYLLEAIAVERAGHRVAMKKTAEFALPDELAGALAKSAKLKQAFEALTPGRQRGYLLYIGQAKKSETRAARVAKETPRILAGLGLDD